MIWYILNDHSVLMNNWQDFKYFTGFFSTLFLLDCDSHLLGSQKQPVFMLLKMWVKWAVSYHSWRYVMWFPLSDFSLALLLSCRSDGSHSSRIIIQVSHQKHQKISLLYLIIPTENLYIWFSLRIQMIFKDSVTNSYNYFSLKY